MPKGFFSSQFRRPPSLTGRRPVDRTAALGWTGSADLSAAAPVPEARNIPFVESAEGSGAAAVATGAARGGYTVFPGIRRVTAAASGVGTSQHPRTNTDNGVAGDVVGGVAGAVNGVGAVIDSIVGRRING